MSFLCIDHALERATNSSERERLQAAARRFEPARAIGANLGAVKLRGSSTLPPSVVRGQRFPLELVWRCRRTPDRDYTVFAYFDGPGGSHFGADHLPAAGLSSTSWWEPGEQLRDLFEVEFQGMFGPEHTK